MTQFEHPEHREPGRLDNREFRSSDLAGAISAAPDIAGMRGRKLYAFARRR